MFNSRNTLNFRSHRLEFNLDVTDPVQISLLNRNIVTTKVTICKKISENRKLSCDPKAK